LSALHTLIDRGRNFLEHELWEMDATDKPWWRRTLINQGQILALVVRGFIADGCMLRASALTFTTLLSLVPLLALVFSVLKGFGVQNELEPFSSSSWLLVVEKQSPRSLNTSTIPMSPVWEPMAWFF